MDSRFEAFLLVSTVLIVTPGPDTALVIRNAIAAGRRAASFTTWGIALGIFIWGVASMLGVGLLLETSAIAFTALKVAGAAYLVFLGVRTLVISFRHRETTEPSTVPRTFISGRAAFAQGLFGNLVNPKAGAIWVSVVPQFIVPGDPPMRLALMLAAFEAILIVWLNLYGVVISRAGASRLGIRVREALTRITGAVLIGLGVRLAFERR